MTPLEKTLKRSLKIKGEDFVVTITPAALKITRKAHQRGLEMPWESLISGESALAVALQASVGKFQREKSSAKTMPFEKQSKSSAKKLKKRQSR